MVVRSPEGGKAPAKTSVDKSLGQRRRSHLLLLPERVDAGGVGWGGRVEGGVLEPLTQWFPNLAATPCWLKIQIPGPHSLRS